MFMADFLGSFCLIVGVFMGFGCCCLDSGRLEGLGGVDVGYSCRAAMGVG